jgi:hypothetical protein
MKYFPLKILLLLVIMTVAAHFVTIHLLEKYLAYRYTREIENVYIGDTKPLFEGRISLSEAIGNNIDSFLQKKSLILSGAIVDVRVTSGNTTWVYPAPLEIQSESLTPPSAEEIAAENYRLMNRGLSVAVKIILGWNAFLVILTFIVYVFGAAVIFLFFYRAGARKAKREAEEKESEILRLRDMEEYHQKRAEALNKEKHILAEDIASTKKSLLEYKMSADKNEDAMIDEIISLEEKIQKNLELAETLRRENEALKEIAQRYENEKQRGAKKSVVYGNVEKRFKTLYKNLVFHKRFLDGFLDLVDDMKIKSEEVVRQLNDDFAGVNIKRKVELQKSREKVFEVIFAYNGRLYFRNTKEGRVEVLAVGTKNTQVKDLHFLDTL